MRTRLRLLTGLLAASLAVISSTTSAQEISTAVSTDSVYIGEAFFVTVSVDLEAGYRAIFPTLISGTLPLGDVELIQVSDTSVFDAAVAHTESWTYEAAAFGVDSAMVGGVPVAVLTPTGDTLVGQSPYVQIGIWSTVPEDAQGLRDLAPLATFPPLLWPWIVGAILVLLAAALGYYFWSKSKGRIIGDGASVRPRLDPYNDAIKRLRILSEQNPVTDEEIRAYYIELSDTLRTYLEYTVSIPALERTSAELVLALKRLSAVSMDLVGEDTIEQIQRSLDVSDLAKFASYRPPETENEEVLELTSQSIKSIENARQRRLAAEAQEAHVQ